MKKELYCRRVLTVCPRKNGYGGISGHIWKCVRHSYDFIIWFIMSNTLKLLYKKIFGINQIVWNMRLWRWTQIKLGVKQASRYRPSNIVNQTLGYCCGNLLIVARSMVPTESPLLLRDRWYQQRATESLIYTMHAPHWHLAEYGANHVSRSPIPYAQAY